MWRLLLLAAVSAAAQDLPRGQIVDAVKCAADPSQSYVLYVPSNYAPTRTWNVIFAFDPGARGRRGVEAFQAAAEKYGYIVAGSNNSRNGPWEVSLAASQAMIKDVTARFTINPKRRYTAGQSGGARVAMQIALDSGGQIAGVFASSAGFPDEAPHKTLPFVVFGTAGTEDFNNSEMHQLDRDVTSAHRVMIFEGGHTWLSSALAVEAVEWMEIQAMKSGRRSKDDALIRTIFDARLTEANAMKNDLEQWRALHALAADFQGLADVAKIAARATALERQRSVKDGLARERAEEQREAQLYREIASLEEGLDGGNAERRASLEKLQNLLLDLKRQRDAPQDSAERRLARRVVSGVLAGGSRGIDDPDYQALLATLRPPGRGRQ